jgi:hypothetical protein
MQNARTLLESIPAAAPIDVETLAAAIEVLQDCAAATSACSAAMLGAGHADKFTSAIARDLDCADVANTTLRVLIRRSGTGRALLTTQLEACLVACEQSNELCGPHAHHHEHCKACSEATKRCADQCRKLLLALRD